MPKKEHVAKKSLRKLVNFLKTPEGQKVAKDVGVTALKLAPLVLDPKRKTRKHDLPKGKLKTANHGYQGRAVMDYGKGHAHAIVDIPWQGLQVKYDPDAPFDVELHAANAMIRFVENPRPSNRKQLIELQVTVAPESFEFLQKRFRTFFTESHDGRLIRRGSDSRPTGIFIDRR